LQFGDFNFIHEYKKAVQKMIQSEQAAILRSPYLEETAKEMRLRMMGDTETYFNSIFDESSHNALVESGQLRFSYKATLAALLINLYRDEPILQMPFSLLQKLMDIDEGLTLWRYRHAQMVLRMLGKKVGTGGSSGHDYLSKTAQRHQIFVDLHNISTLMIPRSHLPQLPREVIQALGFHFTYSK
jgi:tryptophan 2,3-dioxygenase